MGWQRNHVTLSSGMNVRYSLFERCDANGNAWYVRFKGPAGKKVVRSTTQAKKPQAIETAHRMILEE